MFNFFHSSKKIIKSPIKTTILLFLVFLLISEPMLGGGEQNSVHAAASPYGALWYEVTIEGKTYAVYTDFDNGQSISGPLHQSQHDISLQHIYVLDKSTNLLVTDSNLRTRAVLLAQNQGVVNTSTDWMNLHSNINHITFYNITDYDNHAVQIALPSSVNDFYANFLITARFGNNLSNPNLRTSYYEEVIRNTVFPTLVDERIAELEQGFQRDIGPLLAEAKNHAVNSGEVIGTASFTFNVTEYILANRAMLKISAPLEAGFSKVVSGLGLVLDTVNAFSEVNQITADNMLMIAYMQGMGEERLAALNNFAVGTNQNLDPAFRQALANITSEVQSIDAMAWYEAWGAWIQQNPLDVVFFVVDVVEMIADLSGVVFAPPVLVIIAIYKGIKVFYAAAQWLNNRDDRVATAGLAKNLEYWMIQEMETRFIPNPPSGPDLEKWLLLSNMRLFVDQMYYDLLLQRNDLVDFFVWTVWGWNSTEVNQYLTQERNLRWNSFIQTLPRVYWAFDEYGWLSGKIAGTLPKFKISGYVKYQNGATVSGVWVSNGVQGDFTDNTGRYDITGVIPGNYVVTPSFNTCTFTPPSQNILVDNLDILIPTEFTCIQIQSGLSLTTDQVDIPFDGSSVAHLTATLRDANNNPISGVPIIFSTNYTGGITSPVTTGTDGKAISTFTPSEAGPVQITARSSGGLSSNTVNLNVSTGSNSIDTILEIRVKSQTATTTTYHIDGKSTFISNGSPVEYTDILYAILDQNGNPLVPQISTYQYGMVSNPGNDRTDNYGNSDVEFTISSSALATIRSTILGNTDSIVVNLQAGVPVPTAIQPFTVMSFPVDLDTDLKMSPNGDWIISTYSSSRLAQAFNARTYQLANTFTHTDYFGRPWAVDFSQNGAYLAIGTSDSPNGYSAMAYEGVSPFTYFRGRSPEKYGTSEYLGDIEGISMSPNGDRMVTVKPTEILAQVWNVTSSGTAPVNTFGGWSESVELRAVDWSPSYGSYSQGVIGIAQIHTLYMHNGNGYARIGSPITGFDSIRELEWSRDGSKLAVVDEINLSTTNIKLYNQTGGYIKTLALNYQDIFGIDWNHSGTEIAAATESGKLVIITVSDGSQKVYDIGGRLANVQWSGDDSEVFIARENNNIAVYALLDNLGPAISAQTNATNSQTTQASTTVTGNITDPHFVVNPTIKVNSNSPAALSLNGNGGFSQVISLEEGPNTILISAQDGSGFSNSLTLNVNRLTDTIPPNIASVRVSPTVGDFNTLFTITANVSDAWSGLNTNSIYVYIQKPNESNLANLQMFDNGTNGDTTASDGIFSAQWQSTQLDVEGIYYLDIVATDNRSNTSEAENGAVFELGDSPSISTIALSPPAPTSIEPVSVSVAVTDRSGISDVDLFYAIGEIPGSWTQSQMYLSNGTNWVGQIPIISSGALVTYKVVAMDTFGHSSETTSSSYRVIDRTSPTVGSITRVNANPTSVNSVSFTMTFSEAVYNVDKVAPFNDLSLTTTGITGASVSSVSGSGSIYTVTVNTGSGNGTIRLKVLDNNSIVDGAANLLGGAAVGDGNYSNSEIYTIIKSPTFADVSLLYWANGFIERLYNAGITGGCAVTPLNYCPDATVTRAQMAVFLLKGIHGRTYSPPAVNGITGFTDVATNHWAAPWIKQLAAESITGGCGTGIYCPEANVTRAQMAVFLLKAKHSSGYIPPAATGIFSDVPVTHWARNWIEQLAAESITSGCGPGTYCPEAEVTRAQMAVFLVKTFNLP